MLRIGMIGESEYDRAALKNLLSRYYNNLQFVPLLKKVRGTQLDQEKTIDILEDELYKKNLDIIIVQRDLDAPEGEQKNTQIRNAFFISIAAKASAKSFFVLHVQTLEALILADLDGFNKKYKTTVTFNSNPMFQEKPKRWLRDKCKTGKYEAKDSPALFEQLDIEKLKKQVKYFQTFITEFEEYLKNAA